MRSPFGDAYEIPYKIPSYRCAIVGDSKVGKTAYTRRLTHQDNINYYEPTMFTHVCKVIFRTTVCDIRFDMYDTPSDGKLSHVLHDMDCAIVMFDHCNEKSFKSVRQWISIVRDACPTIPIVVCGNECQLVDSITQVARMVDVINKKDKIEYCDISTHACIDLKKPYQIILEHLTRVPIITGCK